MLNRLQNNVDPFVVHHLTKEPKAISRRTLLLHYDACAVIGLTIGYMTDAIGIDAPFGIMLNHETARRGENVNRFKMLLHPHFAHKKELWRKIRETLMTAHT